MSELRAVTFDCWGTLLMDHDFTRPLTEQRSRRARLDALASHAGDRLNAVQVEELLERAWREHYKAWVGGEQYGADGVASYCVDELGDSLDQAPALARAFEDAVEHNEVHALDGSVDALKFLRGADIRTALVCDTGYTPGRLVRQLLDSVGLLDHLEVLIFSNEIGVPKPNAKMFHAALDGLGVEAGHAAHVGDLLRTDIAGARAVGMRTVRINEVTMHPDDPSIPEADSVISSHEELIPALKSLGANL